MPKSLLGSPSETMENNGNIALGVGVILLLLNVGVGVSGVLDGVIEGNVETAVKDGSMVWTMMGIRITRPISMTNG